MELGLAILLTDYSIAPAALGASVEERGFESLFFAEHTHIPVEPRRRRTRAAASCRGSTATRSTRSSRWRPRRPRRERLQASAPGSAWSIERDPITTAKEVATLDYLSGGRFLFGVGAGWNVEEMRNHGTDPTRASGSCASAWRR